MPVRSKTRRGELGLVLTSASADNPFCATAFCSSRLCRRDFAFACFALPRRYRSTARPALGRDHECVGDQFLGRPLSFLHLPDLLLARANLAFCSDWDGFWRPFRLSRFGSNSLGESTGRTFLHSDP